MSEEYIRKCSWCDKYYRPEEKAWRDKPSFKQMLKVMKLEARITHGCCQNCYENEMKKLGMSFTAREN